MILSICIPTHNRGHRAFELATELLETRRSYGLEDLLEIVVAENGSNNNHEG